MGDIITFLKNYAAFAGQNAPLLIGASAVMVIWLFSGCLSASIAEDRLRSPWFHFCLGMMIPYLYPLIMLFKLPVYTPPAEKPEKQEKVYQKVEGPPPVDAAPPAPPDTTGPAVLDTQMVAAADVAFDRTYFKQISVDMSGNHRGPFIFKIKGNDLKVERIVECLEQAVMVEFISADNKTQSIRVPYKNIEACKELS